MTIKDTIKNWLVENELYYRIEPADVKEIEKYRTEFFQKLPDLYQYLREREIIPRNSYDTFQRLLAREMNVAINNGMFN